MSRRIGSVYVAASTGEIERAEKAMELVRAADLEVTSTWVEDVRKHGANPVAASTKKRLGWAESCLRGVRKAGALWLLMPEEFSHGAFTELGYALGVQKPVVISGSGLGRSVFTVLGECVATDMDALPVLCRWRDEGVGR